MISFLLPTNRISTNLNVVNQCVNSIINSHNNDDIEILIYSQEIYNHQDSRVKFIQESSRTGPIFGFNFLSSISNGDIVVCMTDDQALVKPCVETDFVEDVGIAGLRCGGKNTIPVFGDVCGDSKIDFHVPKLFNIRWPVVSKWFLKKYLNSHIFHPDLFYHAGDIYLTFYLDRIGVNTDECVAFINQIQQLKDPTFEIDDCNKVRLLMSNFDPNQGYLQ